MNSGSGETEGLIQLLRAGGFFAKHRSVAEYPSSVVCAQFEPTETKNGIKNGISFWVTKLGQDWYLRCWSYRFWKVPSTAKISDVCLAYLKDGKSAACPPDSLVKTYDLTEIELSEFQQYRLN